MHPTALSFLPHSRGRAPAGDFPRLAGAAGPAWLSRSFLCALTFLEPGLGLASGIGPCGHGSDLAASSRPRADAGPAPVLRVRGPLCRGWERRSAADPCRGARDGRGVGESSPQSKPPPWPLLPGGCETGSWRMPRTGWDHKAPLRNAAASGVGRGSYAARLPGPGEGGGQGDSRREGFLQRAARCGAVLGSGQASARRGAAAAMQTGGSSVHPDWASLPPTSREQTGRPGGPHERSPLPWFFWLDEGSGVGPRPCVLSWGAGRGALPRGAAYPRHLEGPRRAQRGG